MKTILKLILLILLVILLLGYCNNTSNSQTVYNFYGENSNWIAEFQAKEMESEYNEIIVKRCLKIQYKNNLEDLKKLNKIEYFYKDGMEGGGSKKEFYNNKHIPTEFIQTDSSNIKSNYTDNYVIEVQIKINNKVETLKLKLLSNTKK